MTGYGIEMWGEKTTAEKIKKLLDTAPKLKKYVCEEYLGGEEPTPRLFKEYENERGDRGLGALIAEVMCERLEPRNVPIEFFNAQDGDYVLLLPQYKWEESDDYTREEIDKLFREICLILFNKELYVATYDVDVDCE